MMAEFFGTQPSNLYCLTVSNYAAATAAAAPMPTPRISTNA